MLFSHSDLCVDVMTELYYEPNVFVKIETSSPKCKHEYFFKIAMIAM